MKFTSAVFYMPVEMLLHHPDNPRKDLGDLTELTDSIKQNGVMQNLTVVPVNEEVEEYVSANISGINPIETQFEFEEFVDRTKEDCLSDVQFYVMIGNRRFEAAVLAGQHEVPVRIVTGLARTDQIGVMLEENMQRNDLTIPEQAYGFQQLIDLGESVEDITEKSGFSKSTVYHRLNIAKLDKDLVEDVIENHQFTINDFSKLERISDVEKRNKILKQSPGNISWAIERAITEENNEKSKREMISAIKEEFDVKQFPEDAKTWESGWERKGKCAYGEKPDLSMFEEGTVYYTHRWDGLDFWQFDEEAKKAAEFREIETGQDNEEKKKAESELESLFGDLKKQIYTFFRFRVSDEINEISKCETDSEGLGMMWEWMVNREVSVSYGDMFIDEVFTEEVIEDENDESIKTLSVPLQMALNIVSWLFLARPWTWNLNYREDVGYHMADAVAIFKREFNFELENEDEINAMLDGMHKSYRD